MHPNSAPRRRRHSDELKVKVLAACAEPGASISGVALAHGLNANLVRKWRSGRGSKRVGMAMTSAAQPTHVAGAPEFIAIEMPVHPKAAARATAEATAAATTPLAEPLIHIELRRGALHLNVRWPSAAAKDCRAWLSELSSGLRK